MACASAKVGVKTAPTMAIRKKKPNPNQLELFAQPAFLMAELDRKMGLATPPTIERIASELKTKPQALTPAERHFVADLTFAVTTRQALTAKQERFAVSLWRRLTHWSLTLA